MGQAFEQMLAGGHPNSLGRTIEVVDIVLAQPERFEELFDCYRSPDRVVRLRTSKAMKRIEMRRPDLLQPYLDRFIAEVGKLDQASAQWTLAQLFDRLWSSMSTKQKHAALDIMMRNLKNYDDWIVLNTTIHTLSRRAKTDQSLADWLRPQLERLSADARTSVASRAAKSLRALAIFTEIETR